MKRKYGKLAIFIAVAILTLSIASTGFAADTIVNLKAYYRNIKIFKNGTQTYMTSQPFIVDGTTYLPLRAIAELLDKDITWNGTTYSIGINDRPGFNPNELYNQVITQQQTIKQLEAKLAELDKTSNITSIKEMEKYLNKEYGIYKKVYFDIDLSETKSKINVEIFVDLDKDYSSWNKLTSKDIESYLQGIVDDISEAFPKQTISGYIEDFADRKELLSFTVTSKGKVSTSKYGSSSSSGDVDDMEYDLDKYYAGKNGIEEVRLEKSGSILYLTLYVDKAAWNKLTTSKEKDILQGMYKDIRYYFDETIYGDIVDDYNNKPLYEFDYTKGVVSVY